MAHSFGRGVEYLDSSVLAAELNANYNQILGPIVHEYIRCKKEYEAAKKFSSAKLRKQKVTLENKIRGYDDNKKIAQDELKRVTLELNLHDEVPLNHYKQQMEKNSNLLKMVEKRMKDLIGKHKDIGAQSVHIIKKYIDGQINADGIDNIADPNDELGLRKAAFATLLKNGMLNFSADASNDHVYDIRSKANLPEGPDLFTAKGKKPQFVPIKTDADQKEIDRQLFKEQADKKYQKLGNTSFSFRAFTDRCSTLHT